MTADELEDIRLTGLEYMKKEKSKPPDKPMVCTGPKRA
jgi:hypothetical protein